MIALPVHQMHWFMGALKERYRLKSSNGRIEDKLLPEIEMINHFTSFVEKKKRKTSSNFNTVIKKYVYLLDYLSVIKMQLDEIGGRTK